MIAKDKHYFEAALEYLIEQKFEDSENFHVICEHKKYDADFLIGEFMNRKQDQFAVAEIYYKSEYICDVNEKMNPKDVVDRICFALSLKPELTVQKDILDISQLRL